MHIIIIHNHDICNAQRQAREFKNDCTSFLDERVFDGVTPNYDKAVICYDVQNRDLFKDFNLLETRKVTEISNNVITDSDGNNVGNQIVTLNNGNIKVPTVTIIGEPDYNKLDGKKECPVCGKIFKPINKNQVYCSKECKTK